MTQRTKSKVWPTDKTFVVFMVPAENSIEYGAAMNQLAGDVLRDLGWTADDMELVGLIAATPQHGTEGIFFLEEMGVDTREVTLLVLWGETAECVHFEDYVPAECGIGTVILPATGVIIPTVRMPSLDGDWWTDPVHQEYAAIVFASLVRDGRLELDETTPYVFVAGVQTWN